MKKETISNRALAAMVSGIEKFPDTENGGILLGVRKNRQEIAVIEAIEAGADAIHEKGRVFFDVKSIKYIANTIKGLYHENVEVIGIWHKHNHNNTAFSNEDHLCHEELCQCLKRDIVSILFEKNKDNEYTMRVFRYCLDHQLIEEEFDVEDLTKMISYRTW